MRTDDRDLAGCIAAQAGARGRGALPAQAHVAAWVAERAREGARPGWMSATRYCCCWAARTGRPSGRAGFRQAGLLLQQAGPE